MSFSFLDYIWRGLAAGTMTSLMVMAVLFVTVMIVNNRADRMQVKNFFHAQILLLVTVFIGSFLWVACIDPELASGCFSLFAKDKSFFTLTRLFAAIWGMGVIALGARDLYRIFKVDSAILTAIQETDLNRMVLEVKNRMGLKRPVQIYTGECESPYAIGFVNLKVVLPEKILQFDEESLKHIIAHELVHLRDRDSLWKAFELLARRLLFFNPLSYLLGQRHLIVLEKAADEEAVQFSGGSARKYVETLIQVVSLQQGKASSPLALHASRTFKETKERMEALLENRDRPRPTKWVSLVMGSALLASFGMSVAQARSTVGEALDRNLDKGLMCAQVNHEKVIEAWLRIEVPTNKCEE